LIALSGCSTKTIKISVPDAYLVDCETPAFIYSEQAKLEAYNGEYKALFIEQGKYALQLQKAIDECNARLSAARKVVSALDKD